MKKYVYYPTPEQLLLKIASLMRARLDYGDGLAKDVENYAIRLFGSPAAYSLLQRVEAQSPGIFNVHNFTFATMMQLRILHTLKIVTKVSTKEIAKLILLKDNQVKVDFKKKRAACMKLLLLDSENMKYSFDKFMEELDAVFAAQEMGLWRVLAFLMSPTFFIHIQMVAMMEHEQIAREMYARQRSINAFLKAGWPYKKAAIKARSLYPISLYENHRDLFQRNTIFSLFFYIMFFVPESNSDLDITIFDAFHTKDHLYQLRISELGLRITETLPIIVAKSAPIVFEQKDDYDDPVAGARHQMLRLLTKNTALVHLDEATFDDPLSMEPNSPILKDIIATFPRKTQRVLLVRQLNDVEVSARKLALAGVARYLREAELSAAKERLEEAKGLAEDRKIDRMLDASDAAEKAHRSRVLFEFIKQHNLSISEQDSRDFILGNLTEEELYEKYK